MKKLNHLKKFESLFNNKTNYELAAKKIYNDLQDIFDNKGLLFRSFSDLVRKDEDFDYIWQNIKEELEQKGYNLRTVKHIVDNSKWLKDKLEEWNGAADILMYKLYNDVNYLSGQDVEQMMYFDEEYEDDLGYNETLKVKYDYGYTTHPYGKLVIERDFGSVEKFMKYYREKVLHESKKLDIKEDFNGIQLTIQGTNFYNINVETIKNIIMRINSYKDYFNNEIKFESIYFDFPTEQEPHNKKDIFIEVSDIEGTVITILYDSFNNRFEINEAEITKLTKKIIDSYCSEKIYPYCLLKFILKEFSKFTYLDTAV